jgi:hypothetical protein
MVKLKKRQRSDKIWRKKHSWRGATIRVFETRAPQLGFAFEDDPFQRIYAQLEAFEGTRLRFSQLGFAQLGFS